MLNLKDENLITVCLDKKGKYILKNFECNRCGQLYIYIVKSDIEQMKCNICSSKMIAKGE